MNSKENFEIKLKIKDKDGKIINLNKTVDLEVNWEERKAKVPQEIVFKKDGKEYQIIITKLEIFKGLLKKSTGSFNWNVPPNVSYQIYHDEPSSGEKPKLSGNDEDDDYYIKLTNPWKTEVITTLLTTVIIIIAFILFLWGWKKSKK